MIWLYVLGGIVLYLLVGFGTLVLAHLSDDEFDLEKRHDVTTVVTFAVLLWPLVWVLLAVWGAMPAINKAARRVARKLDPKKGDPFA